MDTRSGHDRMLDSALIRIRRGRLTMLHEAVRRRPIARLTEARERVAAAGIPPLTMEQIQAEIDADRAERSGRNDG